MKTESDSNYRSVYLFQIDSARENRPFFEGMHEAVPASIYFRGLDFRVGPWTPDGMRVDLEMDSCPQCSLTLVELEPTESLALRSSRKYLRESSSDIRRGFMQYLQRVIDDCDSRADSRATETLRLKEMLARNTRTTVWTAGALRSGVNFLERSLLAYQTSAVQSPEIPQPYISTGEGSRHKQCEIRGKLRLSPEQSKSLRRCLSILDAVIRKDDHSGAIYHSWRQKTPLKNLLKKDMSERFPILQQFLLNEKNSGITVDSEVLLVEIVDVWTKNDQSGKQIDVEVARNLIEDYFSTAAGIRQHDEMGAVFEAARQFLENRSYIDNGKTEN